MKKLVFVSTLVALTISAANPALSAIKPVAACSKTNKTCSDKCTKNYDTAPDRMQACFNRCDIALMDCLDVANKDDKKKVGVTEPAKPKTSTHATSTGVLFDTSGRRPQVTGVRAPMLPPNQRTNAPVSNPSGATPIRLNAGGAAPKIR